MTIVYKYLTKKPNEPNLMKLREKKHGSLEPQIQLDMPKVPHF